MAALLSCSAIILIFAIIPSISTSGHLRLDIISSNNCALCLISEDLQSEVIHLKIGNSETYNVQTLAKVSINFNVGVGKSATHTFGMKPVGQKTRDIFEFGEIVILVLSTFECDEGFTGSECELFDANKTSTIIPIPITTKISSQAQELFRIDRSSISFNIIICIVLAFIVIVLFLITYALHSTFRRQSFYIDPVFYCESLKTRNSDSTRYDGFPNESGLTDATYESIS